MSRRGRARRRTTVRLAALIAVLAWLALASVDGVRPLDLLAGAAAAVAGLVAPRALRRIGEPVRAATPVGRIVEETEGEEVVDRLATSLRDRIGADRLVLWRLDPDDGRVFPFVSAGHPPAPLPSAGQPLLWALEQGQALRLDPEPSWARGNVLALPVLAGNGVVLSIESEQPVDPAEAAEAAELLAGILRMTERERRAVAANARYDRLLEFLEALPGDIDPGTFPGELARAAAEIAGGAGALVASWTGDTGRVLERWGEGGGPAPGTYIGVMSGQLAMAARARSTLRRSRREGRMPPLAESGERWTAAPSHVVVVPLADATGDVRGLIAVWGEESQEEGGVALLEALAPLLALQLQHASELVQARQRANVDPLTGLHSRAALDERLREERQRFHRYRRPFGLIVVDLDHFKRVNDTLGHPAGDAVLGRVGEVIAATIREVDYAARFGGEEIVVLLPETMRREAGEAAERIRVAIENARIEWGGRVVPVTASLGVSACPECTDDPERVLKSADEALYESKRSGRNRVTTASYGNPGGVAGG